jgi:hypothetical protein
MKISITTRDGRWLAHEKFAYIAHLGRSASEDYSEGVLGFQRVRQWCVDAWGMSCDLDHYLRSASNSGEMELNDHWCWHSRFLLTEIYLIYLAGDAELDAFNAYWSTFLVPSKRSMR